MEEFYQMPMYYDASAKLFDFAKEMRKAPTDAEKQMWQILNTVEFRMYRFRRQHPIARFIADFYSHSLLMVIEIDGEYHRRTEQKEHDKIRDEDMNKLGVEIIRLSNDEVLCSPSLAINKIREALGQLKHHR